ncbi:MAG: SDR family NAD(P)-dependent oxidoreductase [Phycisphaerae bacterium]|nr:SDR family NAD(P)-dependent oxidoreductase [Gemmatimonadaceae bacterium]
MHDFLDRISHFSQKRLILLADQLQRRVEQLESDQRAPVAIVGIGCRIPGGINSPEQYWDFLCRGGDAIVEVPAERWDINEYFDADPDVPGKMATRFGGFIERVDQFDPHFFGISPREAQRMDPQQRLLLEVAWEALEHAGFNADTLEETRTSVFVGLSASDYFQIMRDNGVESFDAYTASGTAHSIASGRLSYHLGLRGPSVSIDTACSSSLMAIHNAVQSLRRGESEVALAGGVNLILGPDVTIALTKARMLAPDGRCKAFDAKADGFVRSEGCGMLVLKRLSDATAAGDRIVAVIRGIAANQDGRSNGLTAPNGPSQVAVLRDALADAGLQAHQVSLVEAHGTGTSLGDPIEVNALAAAFGTARNHDNPLLIGSVKANIGHLEAAAGVAGVIKMALSLQHGVVTPQQHFDTPNPFIPWTDWPVRVPVELTPWNVPDGQSRVGGVSSFGFSGTNVHALLEEPAHHAMPNLDGTAFKRPLHVLTISARSDGARRELAARYRHELEAGRATLPDFSHSANTGRAAMPYRLAVVAENASQAIARLDDLANGVATPFARQHAPTAERPRIAFLFTGQGSQYAGMTRTFYETQPAFRAALDECETLLQPLMASSLRSTLFDGASTIANLDDTAITQPALFAVEYSLAKMWGSWGVRPTAVLGHSIGEYVAACIAGAMSLADALRLVTHRGRLMSALPRDGAMVALLTDVGQANALIAAWPNDVSIAAVNGPQNVVISGRSIVVDAIVERANRQGVASARLNVSHAFHSPLMEPMLAEFRRIAESVTYNAPQIDLCSNLTGALIERDTISADYWCRHIRQPVQFALGVRTLNDLDCTAFVEVGPHPTLLGLARQSLTGTKQLWLPTLRQGISDWTQVLESLTQLYVHGVDIDWRGFDNGYERNRTVLPRYPFQRARYWADHSANSVRQPVRPPQHPLIDRELRQAATSDRIFETELSTRRFEFLRDHRIFESLLVPSPVLMEMTSAVAALALESSPCIRDFTMHTALSVDNDKVVTLQLVLGAGDGNTRSVRVAAFDEQTCMWNTCATASLAVASAGSRHVDIAQLRARVGQSANVSEFYAWLSSIQLDFGERFRGIDELWHEGPHALARIVQRDGNDTAFGMHPAVLDSCFHVLGAALRSAEHPIDKPFLLSHIEQLDVRRNLPSQFWVHVTLRNESPESIRSGVVVADVVLIDDSGELLVDISGAQLHRTTGIPKGINPVSEQAQRMLHEITWRKIPGSDEPLPAPEAIHAALFPRIAPIASENELHTYAQFNMALNQFCARQIVNALVHLGADWRMNALISLPELQRKSAVLPRHERLFRRLFDILAEDELIRAEGNHWRVLTALPVLPEGDVATLLARYAAGAPTLALTARCAGELANVLRGLTDPLTLLFPGGSLKEMEQLYQSSPPARAYNQLVAEAVEKVRERWNRNRALRILEVGAGTGSTTAFVLPLLAGMNFEYTFTDVSPLFLRRAREKFSDVTEMRYGLLDIGSDIATQEYELAQFDIVIGANVLHATPDVLRTLKNVNSLLVPGGLVILLEGVVPQRFGDMTVGLLEGWWGYTDTDRRNYALMPRSRWLELLHEADYASTAIIVDADAGPVLEEQAIFVAKSAQRAPESPSAQHWLVVADSDGVGDEFTLHAAASGDRVTIAASSTQAELSSILQKARHGGQPFTGVLHMAASNTPFSQITDTPDFWSEQQRLVESLLATVHALVSHAGTPPLTIITRGAQATRTNESADALQATLWGLSHVVAIEHPELQCRRIDLQSDAPSAESLRAVLTELRNPTHDDQIALRDGGTLGRRLTRCSVRPLGHTTFAANRTYLITGGLRGLGLRVAEWMVDKGARSLVLMSRSTPDEPAQRIVYQLIARGVSVLTVQGDVSVAADVEHVLAAIRRLPNPLAGIMHSAGVLDDGVLSAQNWSRFSRVMQPKVLGSWHLHRLAGPLDFLVLFSSGASIAGSPGQANHAAANAFEDALAWYRQARGQPTLSVNWGPWDEIGAAADRSVSGPSYLHRIKPVDGLAALDIAMRRSEPNGLFARAQLAVLSADWSAVGLGRDGQLDAPLFQELAVRSVNRPAAGASVRVASAANTEQQELSLRARLRHSAPNRRQSALLDEVRTLTVKVLGIPQHSTFDVQEPLRQLGLDSLMAVELRNSLGKSVGATLPATITFDHPSVQAIAAYLAGTVFADEFAPSIDAAKPAPLVADAAAADDGRFDDLSDAELALRLSRRLDDLQSEEFR